MKILFISDIHGICNNLDYIDSLINKNKFDKLVVLGDLYYCSSNYMDNLNISEERVKDFLKTHKDILICMKGNCDSLVDVSVSDFPLLSNFRTLIVDDLTIYITHGNEFNKNNNEFNNGILIYGHEHIPYIVRDDNMVYICVGSISLPRGGSKASYTIYKDRCFTIYDIEGNIIDSVKL